MNQFLERLRTYTPRSDPLLPPYMTPHEFHKSRLWPLGRTALFTALRLNKFHHFLIRDGLCKQGTRVIDIASALAYLNSLSDQASGKGEPIHAQLSNEPKKPRTAARRKSEQAVS